MGVVANVRRVVDDARIRSCVRVRGNCVRKARRQGAHMVLEAILEGVHKGDRGVVDGDNVQDCQD